MPLTLFSTKQPTLVNNSPHSAQAWAPADNMYSTLASDGFYLLDPTPDYITPQAQVDHPSPSNSLPTEHMCDTSARGTNKTRKQRKQVRSDEQRRAKLAVEQKRRITHARRIERLRCLLGPAAQEMSKGDVLNYGEYFLQRDV